MFSFMTEVLRVLTAFKLETISHSNEQEHELWERGHRWKILDRLAFHQSSHSCSAAFNQHN